MGDGDAGDAGPSVGDFGGDVGDAGFGGPAPGNMGDAPGLSDAGLGFGFGDFGFNDSALSSMTDMSVPDLSQALSEFGMEGLQGLPDVSTANIDMNQNFSLQDLTRSKLGQLAMSLLGLPPPARAAFSSNPPSSIANMGINFGLSSLGPVGLGLAALGNMTGITSGITSALGNTNAPSSFQGNDANMGIGEALPGLAGLYAGYQGMRDTDKMLGGLQGLYSQNSPYAQMLRQQLQRRDAAAGRRSQYGPREVQLQAELAKMASGQIGAMSQLQQRNNINRAQMLQQGLGAFQKLGGMNALQQLFGMGGKGGMFDQAATQGLGQLGNLFANNGMDSFGQLPPDLGYDFNLGPFGG